MSYRDLKLIQEKATGLFFTPVDDQKRFVPTADRCDGWLFDEQQALAAIRTYYGGDHGADLVNLLACEQKEFQRWCCRRGGMVKSFRKSQTAPMNARGGKGRPKTFSAEEIQKRTERLVAARTKYIADNKTKLDNDTTKP